MKAPSKGYDVSAVDEFIARAQTGESTLSSSDIRSAAFPVVKGGYSTVDVDAALERLEDTVADHEHRDLIARIGADGATAQARALAQEILNRVARAPRRRFRPAPLLTYGYNRTDVDAFTDRIRAFYNNGGVLSRADVRGVTFRPQLGGYNEGQVDMLLAELVRVMLAAR
jgi:DivIVA domain-containing protein